MRYPRYKYHATIGSCVVLNEEQEARLGAEWKDFPTNGNNKETTFHEAFHRSKNSLKEKMLEKEIEEIDQEIASEKGRALPRCGRPKRTTA